MSSDVSYFHTRKRIVELGRLLVKKGLTHGSSGNLSARVGENTVLITPSGVPYFEMRPSDIVEIDLEGNVISGKFKPSIERFMHLEIYKSRKDVNAVVHSHPINSSALAIVREPLPVLTEEFVIYVGGPVELARFEQAGTIELGKAVVEALGDKKAALMSNHGLVAVGKDLDEAEFVSEIVELHARMYILAKSIGKVNVVPPEIVEKWKEYYYKINEELSNY